MGFMNLYLSSLVMRISVVGDLLKQSSCSATMCDFSYLKLHTSSFSSPWSSALAPIFSISLTKVPYIQDESVLETQTHRSPHYRMPSLASTQFPPILKPWVYTQGGKKTREQKDSNKKKNMKTLTSMLDPFHHFIHGSNSQWVKMKNTHQNRA